MVDGRRLIDRALAAVAGHVAATVICGRAGDAAPDLPDRPDRGLGPLAGLNAALHHAAAHGFDAVLTMPCDVPMLGEHVLPALIAAGPPCFAVTAPVIGLWPVELAGMLDRHLATGQDRSLRHWAERCGARPCAVGPVANINTPADLERYRSGST